MKVIKIVEILLLSISALSYLGSHLIVVLSRYIDYFIWFGFDVSKSLVVDILLVIALAIPLLIIVLILKD